MDTNEEIVKKALEHVEAEQDRLNKYYIKNNMKPQPNPMLDRMLRILRGLPEPCKNCKKDLASHIMVEGKHFCTSGVYET